MWYLCSAIACLLWTWVCSVQAYGPLAPLRRPNGLVTFNPTSEQFSGQDIVDWLGQQAAAGASDVAVQQGSYHIAPNAADAPAHIPISGLRNLRIWMDNVNLTMTQPGLMAIRIDLCSNVTLVGPTVWWDLPGHAQATITNVRATTNNVYEFDFVPDAGYSNDYLFNSDGNLAAEYVNPDNYRLWASPSWSTIENYPTSQNSDGSYTVRPTRSLGFVPLSGFKLLARTNFIFCNQVSQSNATNIIDFTLLNCAGFGWFMTLNRMTNFKSLQIKPAPFAPPGGTQLPARATAADGMHSAEDFIGPSVDSSLFVGLDDDCVAVHGVLGTIVGSVSAGYAIWTDRPALVGETLKFYTPNNFRLLGQATIKRTLTSSQRPSNGASLVTFESISFAVPVGTRYTNQARLGSGFSLTNTRTYSNRGRGIIAKANDGTIADNYFEGVSYAAVNLGPEFTYWGEGDYVNNITVQNNYIKDCNYINQATAAIHLHGDGDNPLTGGNANIRFINNTIYNTSATSIYLGGSAKVTMIGNRVQQPYQIPYVLSSPSAWPYASVAVMTLQNVSFAQMSDNCINTTNLARRISLQNPYSRGTVQGFSTFQAC